MVCRKSITYFSKPGEVNTYETLRVAKERADKLGIKDIVLSSTRGETGLKALELFKDYNLVVVTHVTGYREPGVQEFKEAVARKIKASGGKILTSAHVFTGGVDKAIQNKFSTVYPSIIIAQTLRIFCQGMKVCVETAAMAADAGMIPIEKDVVVIAGTHRGADTAVIIKPAESHNLFNMVVKEIICKPNNL